MMASGNNIFTRIYNTLLLPIRASLRARLLVYFLIIAFIPTTITGLLGFRISSEIVADMASESSVEMVDRISQELNNLFSDTIYFMYHVQEIPSLKQGLREDFNSIENRYLTDFNVSSELQFISDYKREIFGIYVLGENQSKFKSNYYTFHDDDLRNSGWYREILFSDQLLSFGPYEGSFTVKTAARWGMEFFSLGVPFIDRASGLRQGVVLAEFERSLISEIINSTLGKTGHILLLDKDNNIILAPEDYTEQLNFSGLPVSETEDFSKLIINQRFLQSGESPQPEIVRDRSHILIYKSIDIPNWKVIGVIPQRELRIDKDNTLWYIIFTAIAACFLAGIASLKISSSIVRPVTELTELMARVEGGSLQVRMEPAGSDELGRLSSGFNLMTEKLKTSLDEIYHHQGQIRKTELQLLQAQINPHFLYNTLDAIKYLAKRGENENVVRMVVSLARFFRSSLSKGRAVIPLHEELDRIENYLTILKTRYKDKFSYEIEVPALLKESRILKLSLQPIVENAVYHGIKEKPGSGLILIRAFKADSCVIIEVEDSGKGMSPGKMAELEKSIHSHHGASDRNYGLSNVQERMEIFFGSDYGLSFRGRDSGGTIVSLKLPADMEDDY